MRENGQDGRFHEMEDVQGFRTTFAAKRSGQAQRVKCRAVQQEMENVQGFRTTVAARRSLCSIDM